LLAAEDRRGAVAAKRPLPLYQRSVVQVAVTGSRAGTEQVLLDVTAHLISEDIPVTVIVPTGTALLERLAEEAAACGAAVARVAPLYPGKRDHWGNLRQLVSIFHRLRPAVVHYHIPRAFSGFEAVMAGYLARVPVRIRTDQNPIFWPPTRAQRLRLAIADLMVDRIVLVSSDNRQNHIQFGRPERRCVMIPNGVDPTSVGCTISPEARRRLRLRLNLPAHSPIAVMVGANVRKGAVDYVKAAAVACALAPGLHHAIVGGGPLVVELQQMAQGLGIAERVHFLGQLGDLRHVLAAFDLFVLPSHYEGLALTMLEALAAGLPMVATRVDGVSDVFPDDRGALLVDRYDIESLGAAIARLGSDGDLRAQLSAISQKRVTSAFTTAATYQRYRALYEDLGAFIPDSSRGSRRRSMSRDD
jgi:glycosyltransferase involved in cell wall biosynthesis